MAWKNIKYKLPKENHAISHWDYLLPEPDLIEAKECRHEYYPTAKVCDICGDISFDY